MSHMDFYTGIEQSPDLEAIEPEIDGEPPEHSRAARKTRRRSARRARERTGQRWLVIGTYAQVVVVVGSLIALYWWPYPRSCGNGLAAYIGAECMIIGGAMWCTESTWRSRLSGCHVVAVMVLFSAVTLVASELLTRLGYVSIAGLQAMQWRCG